MNKQELVKAVAEKSGVSQKDVDAVINGFIDTVKEQLAKQENVQLVGFGTFEVVERAERLARNPKTGEEVKVPAALAPKFKVGKGLKARLKIKVQNLST
jgi:DNA-binding protein HU-beta